MNNIEKLIELTEQHKILWEKEDITIGSYHVHHETQYTCEQLIIRDNRWFIYGYYCEKVPNELITSINDQINKTSNINDHIYYTNTIQSNIDATINRN